ncbi:hypothetical protein, partial [Desulfosporosinus sp. BG]|uniref:hypothetical protein n=1 Tax=Desulfosporosinus sp. BG TaxID=1633135 RepID=UPI001A9A4C35
MDSTLPEACAPSIIGPETKGTIVSSGYYRRATYPKETLRGEGSLSPHCVLKRTLQQCGFLTSVFGIRKADELFATLRLVKQTPAMWIPNGWNP